MALMDVPATDRALRRRFCAPTALAHPAKLHLFMLLWLVERYTQEGQTILDPMAGIGSTALAALSGRNVILRELEPGWADECCRTAALIRPQAGLFAGSITVSQADAMQPWGITGVDAILTSPPYGCRVGKNEGSTSMASEKVAKRLARIERHVIWTRMLSAQSVGSNGFHKMHYGQAPGQIGHLIGTRYWTAMESLYTHAYTALKPNGLLILVLKDHIRKGQHIRTCDLTIALCERLGFRLVDRHTRHLSQLSLWQRRRRERGEPVIEHEEALILEKTPCGTKG